MKKLRITVEGKTYEVLVEILDAAEPSRPPRTETPGRSSPPSPAASPPPAALSSRAGDIVSPLAGRVVSIDVAVGAEVQKGTRLATLEAMKMNTFIYADTTGMVAAIHVQPGASVEEGSPLLRLV
jgi:biotin carboxyl carrier protein